MAAPGEKNKPDLSDQHWRAGLRRLKPEDVEGELFKAIEEGNDWRFSVLLELGIDFSEQEKYMRAAIESGRNKMFFALAALWPEWEKKHNLHSHAQTAAENGNEEMLRFLVEQKGVNVHADDESLLCAACEKGYLGIVDYLLEKGANPVAYNGSAFRLAAENGHLLVMKSLLRAGVDIGSEGPAALSEAASEGRIDVVRFLLDNGISSDADDGRAFLFAVRHGAINVVQVFIEHGMRGDFDDSIGFRDALSADRFDIALLLLQNGADIDSDSGEMVRLAILRKDENLLRWLLDNGANPDIGWESETPLMYAAKEDALEMVRMLLHAGADHKQRQSGALREAVKLRKREIVRELIAWERECRAQTRVEKAAEFAKTFNGSYTMDGLRTKKGPSGETGLLIAAQTGAFDTLIRKASGRIAPEDIFHPDEGLDTVLSHLQRHKSLKQFFAPDFWVDRPGELARMHELLPPDLQKNMNLKEIAVEIDYRETQKKLRNFGKPPKI